MFLLVVKDEQYVHLEAVKEGQKKTNVMGVGSGGLSRKCQRLPGHNGSDLSQIVYP